jgi:Flp pilus assembly protein TadG
MSIFMTSDVIMPGSGKSPRKRLYGRRSLAGDRRCVVSMEFAILAVPFFAMMLGLMEMGYDLFTQAVLNTVLEESARQIQVGNFVGQVGQTSSDLVNNVVCPNLHGLLECQNLTVGVEPLPQQTTANGVPTGMQQDYFTARNLITYTAAAGTTNNGVTTGGQVCTGGAGQLMLLAGWYNGPTFVGQLIPLFGTVVNINGASKRVHVTYATAGFVDEYFSGGQSTCPPAQNQ